MKISNDTKLNTILFADDQVVITNSEDNLQREDYMLYTEQYKHSVWKSHIKKKQNHGF
jgi:hypothetical protein